MINCTHGASYCWTIAYACYDRQEWVHGLLLGTGALMLLTLYLVFFYVPTDANLGVSQRILYFHAPVAIYALVSIVFVAFGSIMYLVTKRPGWDHFTFALAELGLVLTTIAVGAIWAKPVWGVWWTWDPKLTLTLVLWFVYAGYLMLRAYSPKGSQGARYGAVLALIGAIDAPIVYMAAELWRSTHPGLVAGPVADSGGMDQQMAIAFRIAMILFAALCALVLVERYALRRVEADVDELYQHVS